MWLESVYDKTINTKRLEDESGTYREGYEDYLVGIACHIQPIDGGDYEDIEGQFGRNWLMFCGNHDIVVNDKIVDGAKEYKVVEAKLLQFAGHEHMELTIREYLQ
ncbi:MAG: hypothetical protein PHN89_02715 [Candidatus Pacebacteria bacterium]|nr:hypothetical protein [Candidatus Paceibacterota bacterium]